MATTKRMSSGARRQQILDAAKEIVETDGFHAVTIDRVARRAGITRTLVYQHFTDLPGLLTAFVDRAVGIVAEAVDRVLPESSDGEDPVEVMTTALPVLLEAATRDPATWRLLLSPPEGAPPELHEHIAQGRRIARARVHHLVDRIFSSLSLRDTIDPELTAHMLQTVADEIIRLHLRDPARYPAERLFRYVGSLAGLTAGGTNGAAKQK